MSDDAPLTPPPAPPPPSPPEAPPDVEATAPAPSRPSSRVGWALGLGLVLVGVAAVLAWRTWEGIEATFAVQDAVVAEAEAAFLAVPLLSDDEIATLRRSRNAAHVENARTFGVPPPDTRAEADSLIEVYDLVRIETDSLYVVLPGEYSVPYLTPSAAASVDSVAVRFRQKLADAGLPPFRFAVSSVFRTADDQAALRGVNQNAAAARSSHEYATTYDVTYNPTRYSPAPDALPPPPRVDDRVLGPFRESVRERVMRRQATDLDALAADYPSRLTALLGRALIELEDEGVLIVVRERLQPVYHVTVARRLPPPDA